MVPTGGKPLPTYETAMFERGEVVVKVIYDLVRDFIRKYGYFICGNCRVAKRGEGLPNIRSMVNIDKIESMLLTHER